MTELTNDLLRRLLHGEAGMCPGTPVKQRDIGGGWRFGRFVGFTKDGYLCIAWGDKGRAPTQSEWRRCCRHVYGINWRFHVYSDSVSRYSRTLVYNH